MVLDQTGGAAFFSASMSRFTRSSTSSRDASSTGRLDGPQFRRRQEIDTLPDSNDSRANHPRVERQFSVESLDDAFEHAPGVCFTVSGSTVVIGHRAGESPGVQ